jgi:shikimate dehydrogenase
MSPRRGRIRPDPGPWILGVAGDPVSHSLSPRLHNAAFRRLGLPHVYKAMRCPDETTLRHLIQLSPNIGLKGLNITTPLKEIAARILVSEGAGDTEVRWSRSANTLVLGGRIRGASTDGRGGILFLRELGLTPSARILILGAGATARSLLWHLMKNGWRRVGVVTRHTRSVRSLLGRAPWAGAKDVLLTGSLAGSRAGARIGSRTVSRRLDHEPWDVLLSTWPPEAVTRDVTRLLPGLLSREACVVDINYGGGRDRLGRWAARAGFASHDGRGFLLHQGALSFRMWTGRKPPLDVMRRALGLVT